MRVSLVGAVLHVDPPFSDLELARGIPQRSWLKAKKVWACRPSLANMDYIARTWPQADWDDAAIRIFRDAQGGAAKRDTVLSANRGGAVALDEIEREIQAGAFVKPHPWMHQRKALSLGRHLGEFAYIMDQGTGKTRTLLDDAAYNFRRGAINGLIILAPNSVKTNWISDDPNESDAIDTWLPPDVARTKAVWSSNPKAAQKRTWDAFMDGVADEGALAIMAVNYEALLSDRCYSQLEKFCEQRRVMIAADESTRLGKPGAKRTKLATKIRRLCRMARIMTGTPVIKSPMKAYSQFGFLSEDILGFGSFYSFRSRYAVMGGFQGRQILKYINLDELSQKIAACSFRVKKDECLDLPPKIYQKRRVAMTDEQMRVYKEMKDRMTTEVQGHRVEATIQLTQVMKMQQITGGFVRYDEDTPAVAIMPPAQNPKIIETMNIVEEAGDQSVIVWCNFREEIAAVVQALKAEDYTVGEFHGGVPSGDRMGVRRAFAGKKFQVLVANKATGGIGIDEFKIASVVVNFSRSFNTEDEIQGEDRTHRGGSEIHERITYYDLIVPNTVDVKIVQTLRSNRNISDEVLRDGVSEWI